jgi:hypothetical protein
MTNLPPYTGAPATGVVGVDDGCVDVGCVDVGCVDVGCVDVGCVTGGWDVVVVVVLPQPTSRMTTNKIRMIGRNPFFTLLPPFSFISTFFMYSQRHNDRALGNCFMLGNVFRDYLLFLDKALGELLAFTVVLYLSPASAIILNTLFLSSRTSRRNT